MSDCSRPLLDDEYQPIAKVFLFVEHWQREWPYPHEFMTNVPLASNIGLHDRRDFFYNSTYLLWQ